MRANTAKTAATVTCTPAVHSPLHLGRHVPCLSLSHIGLSVLCCPQERCHPLYHTFLLLVRFYLVGCLTTLGPIWSFCFWLLVLQRARCLHILWTLISVAHVLIISLDQSSCPFSFNFLVWLRATCFSQSCSLKIVNASIPGQLPPLQFSASLPWRRTPDCLLGHTAPLPTDTTEDTEGVTEMLLGPVN